MNQHLIAAAAQAHSVSPATLRMIGFALLAVLAIKIFLFMFGNSSND